MTESKARIRRIFTSEFKLQAVQLVTEKGLSYAEATRKLGLRDVQIRLWGVRLASTVSSVTNPPYQDSVRFFVKLPGWFKVQTPIGNYNPDWGIVMEEVDQFGDKGQRLYLVRETKSTKVLGDMRPSEAQKLKCGSRHFIEGLGVDYKLVVSANELPGGTVVK